MSFRPDSIGVTFYENISLSKALGVIFIISVYIISLYPRIYLHQGAFACLLKPTLCCQDWVKNMSLHLY